VQDFMADEAAQRYDRDHTRDDAKYGHADYAGVRCDGS
jgi:hypothetical protein